jgi:hypothetical protein
MVFEWALGSQSSLCLTPSAIPTPKRDAVKPCLNWNVATSSRANISVRLGSALISWSHCSGLTSIAAPGKGRSMEVDPNKLSPLVPPDPAARRVSSGRPIRTRCDVVSHSSPWPQCSQPVVHESDIRKALIALRRFDKQQTRFPQCGQRHHLTSATVALESRMNVGALPAGQVCVWLLTSVQLASGIDTRSRGSEPRNHAF